MRDMMLARRRKKVIIECALIIEYTNLRKYKKKISWKTAE
jgi:hypothetical protein